MDPATPQPGDVVILQDDDHPRHYAMALHPDAPQLRFASRRVALEMADGFAQRHSVDVWLRDASEWTRLSVHRHPEARTRTAASGS